MYIHKSLKLAILALFITTLIIFSGCTTPPINHPPTIISLTANPQSPIEVNQSTVITCLATDQDGDTLTYTWTKTGGTITGSGSTITWTAPAVPGTYIITCTVSDGDLSSAQSFTILVSQPPPSGDTVSDVDAIAITYRSSAKKFQTKMIKLGEKDKFCQIDSFMKSHEVKQGDVVHIIEVEWSAYDGASNYKVYRSVNGASYILILDEEATPGYEWYYFWDENVEPGNTYSYYVTAYGIGWETNPSEIVTIDTWLPACYLTSPSNGVTITEPTPTFYWSPVGVTSFPYGSIYYGDSDLWVYDDTAGETAWWRIFYDNMTVSTITYNDDSYATPLVPGHNYIWNSYGYGYDENGHLIAISMSEDWEFNYYVEADDIVYRALCIGVGDYIYGDDDDDLLSPPYNVDRMIQIFNQCRFGPLNTEFSTINYLKDWQAIKSNILQGIASTFFAADNNDISYLYYSGHGMRHENTSYLCPADVNYSLDLYISVDELENALSAIPGTKVVFLDTCHSGGFIGKGKGEITISKEELESFNNEIINVFSQGESKGLLTTNQYKVLTACHYYQESAGYSPIVPGDFDPYGVFTLALCVGCGYFNYNYTADTNLDTKVSLQEAYIYVKGWVQDYFGDLQQDVQVYPSGSTFTIVEY